MGIDELYNVGTSELYSTDVKVRSLAVQRVLFGNVGVVRALRAHVSVLLPGGWHRESCGHEHRKPGPARKCGEALARRIVRASRGGGPGRRPRAKEAKP